MKLEKINGEYPNIPSMETRIQELTNELKELSSHLGGHETIAYKLLWDERVSLKRELAAVNDKQLQHQLNVDLFKKLSEDAEREKYNKEHKTD